MQNIVGGLLMKNIIRLFKTIKLNTSNSYYVKMLFYYFCILTILIIVSFTVISTYYFNNLTSELIDSNEQRLTQTSNFLDKYYLGKINFLNDEYFTKPSRFKEIDSFFYDLYNMQPRDFDSISRQLSSLLRENNFLNNLYIYNSKYDTLISAKEGVFYGAKDPRNNISINNNFFDYISGISSDFIVSPVNNQNFLKEKAILTFVHYVNVNEPTVLRREISCVIMTINCTELINFANKIQKTKLQNMLIIDENKKIVASSDNDILYTTLEEKNKQIFDKILSTPSGFTETSIDNKTLRVLWIKSSVNQWRYIYTLSMHEIYQKSYGVLNKILFIFGVVLIGSFFLIRRVTRRMYEPLKRVITSAKTNLDPDLYTENELELLENAISCVKTNQNQIDQIMSKYNALILERLFMEVLNGTISDEMELRKQFKLAGTNFYHRYYRLILVQANSSIIDAFSVTQREFILFSIIDLVKSNLNCMDIRISSNLTAFIVNYDNLDIQQHLNKLCNHIVHELGCKVNFYYGERTENLMHFSKEYPVLKDLCKYAYIYDFPNVFSIDELLTFEYSENYLDTKVLQNLETQLLTANKEAFYQSIDELLRQVKNNKCSYTYAQNLVLQLISIVSRCAKEQKIPLSNAKGQTAIKRILKNDSFDGSTSELFDLFELFFDNMKEKDHYQYQAFAGKIAQFIDDNISIEISLSNVAQHFNISAGYLSKFFKESMGTSFSKYVIDKKFETATQLLKEEAMLSVDEIANRLGYFDVAYFGKQFKSKFGMTPLQYRKNNS